MWRRAYFLFALACFMRMPLWAYHTDVDLFAGSGNVSAKTSYMRDGGDGSTDKIWTQPGAYDSLSLGLRILQTHFSPHVQVGAEFSYFNALTRLPAERIVERNDFSKLTYQGKQAMTSDDRVRFNTGRASFSLGVSLPVLPNRFLGELGFLGGAGLGQVRDATTLLTNGREFTAYASMSVHWGFSLRLRVLFAEFLTAGIEYRYVEEIGKNFGSGFGSKISYSVDSNLFMGWIGYRFEKK